MKDYRIKILKDIPIERTEKFNLNPILKDDEYIGTLENGEMKIGIMFQDIELTVDEYEIIEPFNGLRNRGV